MAKPSSVYSILGMKTPEQVAQEEREKAFEYFTGQRTGYEKAGAGLGLLLGSLFGGESDDMARSREGMEIIQSARAATDKQRAILAEAEAQATEANRPPLSAGKQLMNEYQIRYENFTKIADALEERGFLEEAENARAVAREAASGILATEADLASLKLTEAKTQAENAPNFSVTKPYLDAEGNLFPGREDLTTGIIYNKNTGQPVQSAMPYAQGLVTGPNQAALAGRAEDVAGILINDPEFKGLSPEDRQEQAGYIAAEANLRLNKLPAKDRTANQAQIYQQIWNEIKNAGGVQKTQWWEFWKDEYEIIQKQATEAEHKAANAAAKAAGQTTYTLKGKQYNVQ